MFFQTLSISCSGAGDTGRISQNLSTFWDLKQFDLNGYAKIDEVPYDFQRKRLSILVANDRSHLMITTGAVNNVLDVSSNVELAAGPCELSGVRGNIEREVEIRVFYARTFKTI